MLKYKMKFMEKSIEDELDAKLTKVAHQIISQLTKIGKEYDVMPAYAINRIIEILGNIY